MSVLLCQYNEKYFMLLETVLCNPNVNFDKKHRDRHICNVNILEFAATFWHHWFDGIQKTEC